MEGPSRFVQKKRTANFREDETKLLIQLWGSPLIQNKLFLTHRKAPVMRILAANMQQRGFYRTPDEIKTRIRNLKCLYHRIKRTMSCGQGLGTVDPDWPHYKAMDAILSKPGIKRVEDLPLEGPKCEDIKQEIDVDVNDDVDTWMTNDSMGSEFDDNPSPPPLQPAPNVSVTKSKEHSARLESQAKTTSTVVPSFTVPTQIGQNGRNAQVPSIPLPLLILNGLPPQAHQEKKDDQRLPEKNSNAIDTTLKDLLEVQRERLNLERQRLEVEKQRLEFDRLVGTQLVTLIPMVGGILQRLESSASMRNFSGCPQAKRRRKRPHSSTKSNLDDIIKESKILRTVLEQGIKKCILDGDAADEIEDNDKCSDDDENRSRKSNEN